MLSKDDLKALSIPGEDPYVSIFLPVERPAGTIGQGRIRLKNLVREAQQRLEERGFNPAISGQLLAPLDTLVEDEFFWRQQLDGLALFLSSSGLRFYRLPLEVEERVFVGSHFHLQPLLSLVTNDGPFFVLALSQKQVRLLQGTRSGISEIPLSDVPCSLEEALKYDDPQTQLQYHTRAPSTQGDRAVVFHGHGAGADDSKDRITRFCQQVNRGLRSILANRTAPLVLACVRYLSPIYREANSYPYLSDEFIAGNPDQLSGAELHRRAWPIILAGFQRAQDQALRQYHSAAGTTRTSSRIEEIISAAHRGAVQTLLVAEGAQRWGRFDPETGHLVLLEEAYAEDEELLDLTVTQTLIQGGDVFVMAPERLPQGSSMAAILRYPAGV